MSYNPKTKIIELEDVDIGGDVFYLTSKEKEELKLHENPSKTDISKDKKFEWIIALIIGAIVLALAIWIIYDPMNAIFSIVWYGFIYVLPIILVIKCISIMFLPPKPKNFDLEHYKKMNRLSTLW